MKQTVLIISQMITGFLKVDLTNFNSFISFVSFIHFQIRTTYLSGDRFALVI